MSTRNELKTPSFLIPHSSFLVRAARDLHSDEDWYILAAARRYRLGAPVSSAPRRLVMRSRFKVLGHPLHPILIVFPLGLYPIALVCDLIFLGRFLWDGTIDGFWWGMALWSLIFGGLMTLAA